MFGNEVRFKIGGDITQLERSFSRAQGIAERAGQRMESSMRKTWQAMRAPNETFSAFKERWKAEENAEKADKVRMALAQQRKKIAYDEANTVGRIKIVTQELAELSRARTREKGETVKKLAIELQMEEKLATLRRLRQTQAQTNLAQSGGGVASGSEGGGGGGGIAALMAQFRTRMPQLIFRAVGGAITMGLRGLLGVQRAKQEVADAQAASSEEILGSMRSKMAAVGGLHGQFTQGEARAKDLDRDLGVAKDREKFLSEGIAAGGADFLTKMGIAPDELTKVQIQIQKLNAEIQKQRDENELVGRELVRQLATYDNEITSVKSVQALREKRLATEVKLREVEEERLKRQLEIERISGTPDSQRAVKMQIAENRSAMVEAKAKLGHETGTYDAQLKSVQAVQSLREKRIATEVRLREIEAERLKDQLAIEERTGSPESQRAVKLQMAENASAMVDARAELNRQVESYKNQLKALQQIQALRDKGLASEANLLKVEEARLKRQQEIETKYGNQESQRAVAVQQAENKNERIKSQTEAQQRHRDVVEGLANIANDDRTFASGKKKPRSEAERIAERAAGYRKRAQDIVRTQGRGDRRRGVDGNPESANAEFYMKAAMRDEGEVGERFSAGSRDIPATKTSDFASLNATATNAYKVLQAISASLSITEVE